MFDVFYIGAKPNLFPHEKQVVDLTQAQQLSRTRYFWVVSYLSDYTNFDFLWEPRPWEAHQRHAWPSQHQPDCGTYLVPKQGYTETNYHTEIIKSQVDMSLWEIPPGIETEDFDWTWHPNRSEPPYIYQFGTQWQKNGGPKYLTPDATTYKFSDYPRAKKISIDTNWEIPDTIDANSFDFTWHPDHSEPQYIYQFGTQHQRTGGPRYRVDDATEIKYVDQIRVTTTSVASCAILINHLDDNVLEVEKTISQKIKLAKTVRYFDNYLDTLKRLANSIPDDVVYAWVCSSICDYSNFDFTWHPEIWQNSLLHVFPSDDQKFGDTFFMNVQDFRQRINRFELLEWYDLNFVADSPVPRLPAPVIKHTHDTHVTAIKQLEFTGPYALFTVDNIPAGIPAINLWRQKYKTIVPLSSGGSSVLIPRQAVPEIKSQLYDYAYIDKTHKTQADLPQDVIFISNGEPMANNNWQNLKQLCPRAKHSRGVLGREAAYKAAASLSDTPWFFAVFAKTEVLPDFKFDFQPDRLQAPKHYIFHSRNPLNGLEYGAMNINLYNKQLVLDTVPGIDFTLSAAHEVVPVCASISRFNTDPWITWRSAFREVLKLKQEVDQGAGVEIQYRLDQWCTRAQGENAEHCLQGAQDALEYYQLVNGNNDSLRLSFDWAWLQDYYYKKYKQQPWLEVVDV
jgi:hypothetical protein